MQDDLFLKGESNKYFQRNFDKIINTTRKTDDFYSSFLKMNVKPKSVLELGCANGFRLSWFKEDFNCDCLGIESSTLAIADGRQRFPNITLEHGTFQRIEKTKRTFDLILLGFFIYLIPREKLFKLSFEVDSHLSNNGFIGILDFTSKIPLENEYKHLKGVNSYKFNPTQMFDWNPQYSEVFRYVKNHDGGTFDGDQNNSTVISFIHKNSISNSYIHQRI